MPPNAPTVVTEAPVQPPLPPPPVATGRRHSPRLAASEDPNYVPMVDKATNLKRRKLEGAGKVAAARAVPARAPRDAQGRPSGALPDEVVELAKDMKEPISAGDAADLAAACGVDADELLKSSGMAAQMEE